MYLGDFKEDGDLFHKFTTRAFATGIPTTLAGSPVLSVYKDEGGAATEKTTAETYFDLDVDHDSIAGWNNVRIDLSGDAFFATGADYAVVMTAGTVDSVNVFGENIFTFSIENRSMGQPAGATLAADIAAIKAETALIVADTGELQADDTPGAIAALPTAAENRAEIDSNSTELAALIAAIITNAAGVDIAADIIALKSVADAIPTTAMRGTDGANTTTPPTVVQNRAEMDSNSTKFASLIAAVITNAAGVDVAADIIALDTVADAIKVVTDKFAFTVANQVDANSIAISGSTDAADKLEASAEVIVIGAAEAGTLSTTQMTTDLTEATDDHYKGRTVIWTSGVLIGQASDITAYLGSTGRLTFTAVTEAASAGNGFVIV